ncbi:hypothetical protein [uncultured Acetatifactor sp.]|jgi:hypothetical protein|uniref:phage tail assembly chaperone n=1 Tax=uncultured Acetatifactor sp. TaxID=1671927 RepID=UPI00261A6AAD|nr:hypothetical protein [uncultured Acetatifactor sp.]
MANKNLKYFMREESKQEQVFQVPAPARFVDEKGEVVQMEVKKLHNDAIARINDMYKSRTPMKDKKGNYIVQNGEVVFRTEKDSVKATRHIIVEALVYPDLKDSELMKYYDCVDITDMPLKVFPDNDELGYVTRKVLEILGLTDAAESNEQEVEDAKN